MTPQKRKGVRAVRALRWRGLGFLRDLAGRAHDRGPVSCCTRYGPVFMDEVDNCRGRGCCVLDQGDYGHGVTLLVTRGNRAASMHSSVVRGTPCLGNRTPFSIGKHHRSGKSTAQFSTEAMLPEFSSLSGKAHVPPLVLTGHLFEYICRCPAGRNPALPSRLSLACSRASLVCATGTCVHPLCPKPFSNIRGRGGVQGWVPGLEEEPTDLVAVRP